ncbi:UNVERIFIED_CONTAM: hypothetical protein Slati_1450700 [Sesamum latifolium]|uniref:Zinc knuckle CX2CX4HX4C domain-containing protein n=1 Tax=Sesamum latifolium TaxID=2727402 RepID=A0AAW2X571_9LAMI
MDSDLGHLGSSLSFTQEEELGVGFPHGVMARRTALKGFHYSWAPSINKIFHPEALHTTLKVAFNPVARPGAERCPWAYNKNLLVLAPVEDSDDPNLIDLNWCDFHIHIHGLPLGKMNQEIGVFIGNSLGKSKEVDLDRNGEVCGSSIRIRLALDITKPLKRALKIRVILEDEHLISFTYERLSIFVTFVDIWWTSLVSTSFNFRKVSITRGRIRRMATRFD